MKKTFLQYFPNAKFRYIDSNAAENKRLPVIKSTDYDEALNKQGYDAYFTVNGFLGDAQEKKDVVNINAFFIDIDGRKDVKELEHIKSILLPTFIIETGKGYHVYWLLDEPLFKDEMGEEEWNKSVLLWEQAESLLVEAFNADKAVKDITRILRVPKSFYWKNTGTKWKDSEYVPFKIKGIEKNESATYSIQTILDTFQQNSVETDQKEQKMVQSPQTSDWFKKYNSIFPIDTRDSFKRLVSGEKGTIFPSDVIPRHTQLMAVATYMLEAGWGEKEAVEHIIATGWHGLVDEKREFEIKKSISDVYHKYPLFGRKKENGKPGLFQRLVEHNTTEEERQLKNDAIAKIMKDRREQDKARYGIYEQELVKKYPYTYKNDQNIIFMYKDGVYEMVLEDNLVTLILQSMEDDALYGYRTPRYAKDKIACWMTHIQPLVLSETKSILNVKNGLLDIFTLELKPHTPEFVSLFQAAVSYDKDAKAPLWEECLHAWTNGDEEDEKKLLLQQFIGYVLMPTLKYSKMLFLVGDGGNGKSTFVDTISMMMGRKGTSHVDLEDINGAFGLQRLIGSRLNIVEEVSGNYYKSNKLKGLVSGETVTINIKYENQFDMRPEAKFMFAVNEMPKVDDNSQASERRTLIVMFKNNFRDNPNVNLRFNDGLLAQELPGILNWALQGAQLLERDGFVRTREQLDTLKEYREESNSFEAFIADCLEIEEGCVTSAQDLFEKYEMFCKDSGFKLSGKKQTLTKTLKYHAIKSGKFQYVERKNNKSENAFEGIKLNSVWKDAHWNMGRVEKNVLSLAEMGF